VNYDISIVKDLGITITIEAIEGLDCSSGSGWTLVVETAGVTVEGICSPGVPTMENFETAASQGGALTNVTQTVDNENKKVFTATVSGAVSVKYTYTR
jgi:hypothetical protein